MTAVHSRGAHTPADMHGGRGMADIGLWRARMVILESADALDVRIQSQPSLCNESS